MSSIPDLSRVELAAAEVSELESLAHRLESLASVVRSAAEGHRCSLSCLSVFTSDAWETLRLHIHPSSASNLIRACLRLHSDLPPEPRFDATDPDELTLDQGECLDLDTKANVRIAN